MTKTTTRKGDEEAPQQFVFGIENGKPIGARFPASETRIDEIIKAKGLELHPAYNEEWGTLASELPEGRVYARGKGFIPPIKQALFEKLSAWTKQHAPSVEGRDAPPPGEPSIAFPKTHAEIGRGSLCLAEEARDEGFWIAVVTERQGDILTLKYRDYPKADLIKRTVWSVGLLDSRID